jgi:hypothetical protein
MAVNGDSGARMRIRMRVWLRNAPTPRLQRIFHVLEQVPVRGLLAQGTGKKWKWRKHEDTIVVHIDQQPPSGQGLDAMRRCI